jgi:hypothetical protein
MKPLFSIGKLVILLSFVCIPSLVYAEDLVVSPIQWVQGNDSIPHPALNSMPTMLQAIAEGGECEGQYQYRWDWNGDGDYDDSQEGFTTSNSSTYGGYFAALHLEITFPESLGDRLYYPKVQVICGEETKTTVMPVLIRVNRICSQYGSSSRTPGCGDTGNLALTRKVYADRAVDRGLWYLFRQVSHYSDDGRGNSVHACTLSGSQKLYSLGHALNAFLRRGHGHGADRDTDPYYRHFTQCGLHAMLSNMTTTGTTGDSNLLGVENQAITYSNALSLGGSHPHSYESTAWIEPIASFGSGDYISPAGNAATFERSLRDIGQDLADGLVKCMTADKAWYYSCQNGSGSTTDASTNGWAPEALRLLERKYGVETYQAAKDGQRAWLGTYCPNGICVYHHVGAQLSGNALVGYGWTQDQTFDVNGVAGPSWQAVQTWYNSGSYWGLYYIYASTKGLRSFIPEITYLPNGTNWSNQFTDFFLTGYNDRFADTSARQNSDGSWGWAGSWSWASSVSTNERTGLVIQIIQSWLEVWAYARAFPELVSPGAEVTFDHSWTYTLDPSVNIVSYKWNVIDIIDSNLPTCEPEVNGCRDLNGDRDCLDQGEMCNEDNNANGEIDDDEIRWEFETIDPYETFTYAYTPNIDWGDEEKYNVRLRVTDSEGRYVDDIDSVQVTVSKRNNPPTIIAHPYGSNATYIGYVDTEVVLDGRASYDSDAAQEPYPGDSSRPVGIPDSIVSIHFDLNQDGDFDDEGEDGTSEVVRLTLTAESAIGDLVSIPMRVCDDGQWTDRCLDGLDQDDCSVCSYGSAPIRLLLNSEPPVISICKDDPDCTGYSVIVIDRVLEELNMDLSDTTDPEGAIGLNYHYEILEGNGEIFSDPEYINDPNNMGPKPHYVAYGEGHRIDILQVTVTDSGNLSSTAIIEVVVPNINPTGGWNDLRIEYKKPEISSTQFTSLGDGWYRLAINAQTVHGGLVTAYPQGSDIADTFSAYVDLTGDREAEYVLTEAEIPQGTPAYEFPEGYTGTAWTWFIDNDQGISDYYSREFTIPPKGNRLWYSYDLFGDQYQEIDSSSQDNYTFYYGDFEQNSLPFQVSVIDEGNLRSVVSLDLDVSNQAPIFETTSILRDEWMITLITSALDPNGDTITYEFNPGDGSQIQTNRGGIFTYQYTPNIYQTYSPTITVIDSRGGRTPFTWEVVYEEIPDLTPVINQIATQINPGGAVSVIIDANDPEGETLTIWIDWNDGQGQERILGGRTSRILPYRLSSYWIHIEVQDPSGNRISDSREIVLEDQPTVITQVQQNRLGDGSRLFSVQAQDLDQTQLRYFWDFNNDGIWEEENRVDSIASYTYPDAREYVAKVGVLDPWSNVMTERTLVVGAEHPPVISTVNLSYGPKGMMYINVEAHDPEGGPLTYEVVWGSELIGQEVIHTLPNGNGSYQYAYQTDPYYGRVIVHDQRGLTTEYSFESDIVDSPTLIQGVSISQTLNGEILVRVNAIDLDSQNELLYTFDFLADGFVDHQDQLSSVAVYTHEEAGTYTLKLSVVDPWSGRLTSTDAEYTLNPWRESAIADDHVLGDEGRCVVFRVSDDEQDFTAKVDPSACTGVDQPQATTEQTGWRWDFGDGTIRYGSEVGHIYVDDGIYEVQVSNQNTNRPRQSVIQAYISNQAPTFESDPVEMVSPGEVYIYEIHLEDLGQNDQIQLSLGEGIPEELTLSKDGDDRHWLLTWVVAEDEPFASHRITLKAEDGYIANDGSWVADGGYTEQRYWLSVEASDTDLNDRLTNAETTLETINDGENGSNSNATGTGTNGTNMGTDATDSLDPLTSGEDYDSSYVDSNCDQAPSSTLPPLFLLLMIGLFFKRQWIEE